MLLNYIDNYKSIIELINEYKKITLNKVYECLKNETNEIKIGHNIAEMARKSVLRMAEIGR